MISILSYLTFFDLLALLFTALLLRFCICADVESFRVVRQAEEETGSLSKISNTLKSYYSRAIDTVNGYVEDIKALKLEEQAK